MTRQLLLGFLLVAALPWPARRACAQEVAAPATIDVQISTTPIERNATALSAAIAAASRAGDLVFLSAFPERFRAADKRGAALRLLKLAVLDLPIVHYGDGLNHELGHIARANEIPLPLRFRLVGGPWSARQFDLETDHADRLDLASIGGGFEAELVMQRRLWTRINEENNSDVSDALALLDGALGRIYYIRSDLSALRGRISDDLVPNTGDPTRYVYQFVGLHQGFVAPNDVLAAARSMRSRAWLNFVDAGLWAQAWNVTRYLLRGEATFHPWVFRLRGVGLSPFSQYHLSPVGPQTEVGTRYRAANATGELTVRWTESLAGSRLVGCGFSWSSDAGTVIRPRMRIDLWQGPGPGAGGRIEVGGVAARWPSPRARLQLDAGAKSAGYVLGLPQKRGTYVQAGLRLRF